MKYFHHFLRGHSNIRLYRSSTLQLLRVRAFHSSCFNLAKVQFNLADIGEGITECELIQWFIKEGSSIEQFQRLCEVQSDKATVEITSRYDGKVTKLYYKPGDIAKVGSPLVDIETEDEDSEVKVEEDEKVEPVVASVVKEVVKQKVSVKTTEEKKIETIFDNKNILATPAVRRVARELKVDLASVKGTGRAGRILKEDVFAFHEAPQAPTAQKPSASSIVQLLTPVQKAMVKNMTLSMEIPHFGFSDTLSFDRLKSARNTINTHLKQHSHHDHVSKITFMPLIMKSFSLALQQYPILNSTFYAQGSETETKPHLLLRPQHNISIAIDSPGGLVVPNVPAVNEKSILDIAQDLQRLQEMAKKNQLPPERFQNGTITISNIGNLGGKVLKPVIPPNTVCIVAIGKSYIQPVYHQLPNGSFELRPEEVATVSFSADHRVIDGATVARFFLEWKRLLEHPEIMLLNLK